MTFTYNEVVLIMVFLLISTNILSFLGGYDKRVREEKREELVRSLNDIP